MHLTSTVTTKGQITLPAYYRKFLGIQPADKVSFSITNKQVYINKLPSLSDLYGVFHNPKIKPLTVQQMNRLVKDNMFKKS